ncbi:TIGR01777 family oxidoreductase [Desmospora profundinema]|uniref:Uncharacterized protein (TIGR01777 family) n=1 Tax=Desmospora profundinema TaxID=1571184 RepID=A0ABU1IN37_9BACL|nr:TIGR01777 family oxidoreductase [Desmospora profundinema]MDR6226148.1 uncharacterized protein (TIGR01777 family) [Desmospora profundinema]
MRIAITGSSGLIGTALMRHLEARGDDVTRVIRRSTDQVEAKGVRWDPERGEVEAAGLEGQDALIHLAGENISAGRWTPRQKERILQSRTRGTALLADTLAALEQPPKVWLSASAIGYYGYRDPMEKVDESTSKGSGFLADVAKEWEHSTQAAQRAGIRVVHLRFGVVLSPQGGALAAMLPLFKGGLGGRIGTGKQMMSWVSLADVPPILMHVLEQEHLSGPVNVVSPHPVSNGEFTRVLGRVVKRPTMIPLPGFAARLILGEMADELLLQGCRVLPGKLEETGYRFRHPELEPALRSLLDG